MTINAYKNRSFYSESEFCQLCGTKHSEDADCPPFEENADCSTFKDERADYITKLRLNLPLELFEHNQFVCFRLIPASPKQKKPPYNPNTGELASINKPETWGTFEEAAKMYLEHPEYAGLGFVFTADDPYTRIDLDNCIDPETGEVTDWAEKIINYLESFTEISVSQTGVHILLKGKKPGPHCKAGSIEIYSSERYFTMTGSLLP